jgi:Type II intron maturase
VTVNKSLKKAKISCKQEKVSLGLSILIKADISEIYNRLIENSIVNSKKRPISKTSFLRFDAYSIIMYYNSVATGLLFYFCGVDNLNAVKKIVTHHIRHSLLRTLAHKHKCSSIKILSLYGAKIKAINKCGKEISFINSVEVLNMRKGFPIRNGENSIYYYF